MTTATALYDRVQGAADEVRRRTALVPQVGIILGTGLGGLAKEIAVEAEVAYGDIPGFPLSTVETHAGRLLLGRLRDRPVVAMQGRFHRYEGYDLQQVTFPVRVLHALGARTLVVSNACGGMNPLWGPGDLVLLSDHINLLGDNPLVGPNDERLGPRFPDMSAPYDPELRALARTIALELGIVLREGVYVAVPGPNLETRAEYRMLRSVGADVVGMSTVPEVIVAGHQGMRTIGLSIITDQCLPDALEPADIGRIIATAGRAEPELTRLIATLVERLDLMAFPSWPDLTPDQLEQRQLELWKAEGLFRQTLEAGRGGKPYVFYEGPPTANGRPGIHHVFARTIKDLVCRYHAMQGQEVTRIAGWDTHGLPVEIEVEKELQLSGKKDIERFGVDRVQRPRAEERLQVPVRLGVAVRPDRLLARLRASVRHLQQRVHRDGLVAAAPPARARPALPGPPRPAVLPALRHGPVEP